MTSRLNSWGTMRNPTRVPTPRTRQEWDQSRARCSQATGDAVQQMLDHMGLSAGDVFGHGYLNCRELSAYAAAQAPGLAEITKAEQEAAEDDLKAQFQAWYAVRTGHRPEPLDLPALTVHPLLRCGVCGGRRPHTAQNERIYVCDSCGTKTDVAS